MLTTDEEDGPSRPHSAREGGAKSVVVAHRHTMVAEAIGAALARCPGISVVTVTTSVADAQEGSLAADAAVVDACLPAAEELAHRLHERGVQVVLLSDGGPGGAGRLPISASIMSLAAVLIADPRQGRSVTSMLSRRELEVLTLVAAGLAGKQVARSLGISPKTVEKHKTQIFRKLGVPNQTAASVLLAETSNGFRSGGRSAGFPYYPVTARLSTV